MLIGSLVGHVIMILFTSVGGKHLGSTIGLVAVGIACK